MKNKKMNLDELKVKSFVTDFENGEENTVKGGTNTQSLDTRVCTAMPNCDSLMTGPKECPEND